MNLLHAFQQDDPILMAVFALLCVLSLASWYIIFWKAFGAGLERRRLAAFRQRHAKSPDWPRRSLPHAPVKGAAGLLLREAGKLEPVLVPCTASERRDVLSMHLVQTLDHVRAEMDKGLTLLASIGSASPFIGLFGTVWGIYGALVKISAEGNAGLSVVAGPMGEALVATAAGLFAAIPAVLAYNGFLRINRLLMQDLRHVAEQITVYYPVSIVTTYAAEAVRLVREGR
jgi:biopolymer transport protein ExbB